VVSSCWELLLLRARATSSFRVWCEIDLPGAFLQTNAWRPKASTWAPQWHWCGPHSSSPNHSPMAILAASSSNRIIIIIIIITYYYLLSLTWGTGIRGLMRGMATLPQGNNELLVVRDKVGRPPGEFGISKSMECDIFPFSALTLLVGRQEGHLTCEKTGCWFVGDDLLELCTTYSSSCHCHFHHPLLQ